MENKVPSSISNSDRFWVAQVIGAFLLVMIVASLTGSYFNANKWWAHRDLQAPAFQNEVIIERYLQDGKDKEIVIVGSSAATQLPPEGQRPSNVATLFIQGGGAMTGLEAIIKSEFTPAVVLVEVDFISRGIDLKLIDSETAPFKTWLKRYLPVWRHEQNLINYAYKSRIPKFNVKDLPVYSPEESERRLAPRIQNSREFLLKKPLDEPAMRETISILNSQVQTLEQRGCRVIFFSLPLNKGLKTTPWYARWESMVMETLNGNQFITPSPQKYYYTVDGIHFYMESGNDYFNFLMNVVNFNVE